MRIIFLGAPGAGKGTQAQLLSDKYNIPKLSTGDMLRAVIKSRSELGKKIENTINSGGYVDDEIVIEIIKQKLKNGMCSRGFILDGFPRTINQAKALDNLLSDLKIKNIKILFLDLTEDVLLRRLSGRYACKACNKAYHKHFNPTKVEGICDNCGSKEFEVRQDDSEESVKNRLSIYKDQTLPIIDYYKRDGRLIGVDGNKPIEEITHSIVKKLEDSENVLYG